MKCEAVAIGASVGGIQAVSTILTGLKAGFFPPVLLAQHVHKTQDDYMVTSYNAETVFLVREAEDKMRIMPSTVYIAPPDYHMLVEQQRTLALSMDEKVNFCRPSIDVLFESAAIVYGAALVAIILTGANNDGAMGIKTVKRYGGITVAQNPETAVFSEMPLCAVKTGCVDHILELEDIAGFLMNTCALQ